MGQTYWGSSCPITRILAMGRLQWGLSWAPPRSQERGERGLNSYPSQNICPAWADSSNTNRKCSFCATVVCLIGGSETSQERQLVGLCKLPSLCKLRLPLLGQTTVGWTERSHWYCLLRHGQTESVQTRQLLHLCKLPPLHRLRSSLLEQGMAWIECSKCSITDPCSSRANTFVLLCLIQIDRGKGGCMWGEGGQKSALAMSPGSSYAPSTPAMWLTSERKKPFKSVCGSCDDDTNLH